MGKPNRETSHLKRKIERNLMKRYAVEKILSLQEIGSVILWAFFSFVVFILFWFIYLHTKPDEIFRRILLVAGVIVTMCFIWWRLFRKVDRIIPKFVLIGMLGWILLTMGLVPNFFSTTEGNISAKPGGNFLHVDIPVTGEKDFNLSKNGWLDIAIAPTFAFADNSPKRPFFFRFIRYILLIIALIFLIDIILTVSTHYRDDCGATQFKFCSISAIQREKDIRTKIILFSAILLILAIISINYFLLFWIVSFLAAVTLFRWEILTQGQNHKPVNRSVLFVILTQAFSSIFGEILLVLYLPMVNPQEEIPAKFKIPLIITLGWMVILGSALTVLIGIITQVIWSGRRMTDQMRS